MGTYLRIADLNLNFIGKEWPKSKAYSGDSGAIFWKTIARKSLGDIFKTNAQRRKITQKFPIWSH
jgi:hypothetical protein